MKKLRPEGTSGDLQSNLLLKAEIRSDLLSAYTITPLEVSKDGHSIKQSAQHDPGFPHGEKPLSYILFEHFWFLFEHILSPLCV